VENQAEPEAPQQAVGGDPRDGGDDGPEDSNGSPGSPPFDYVVTR
jgi:hypothetical protein